MTTICRVILGGLIFFCLTSTIIAAEKPSDTQAQINQLEAQNQKLHRQLRQARRDLAQERNAEQQPGWAQVFGGVGIIFGICGIGMMLSARKKRARDV